MEQKDLIWNPGRVNPSGIRTNGFFIDKNDILEYPECAIAPVTVDEQVTLEGDFSLKPGKFWKRIYTTQGEGKADFEGMGEKDCQMFNNKCNLSYPDISKEGRAFAKRNMNSSTIFIPILRTSGMNRPTIEHVVIGGKEYDAEVKITGASGDKPGSKKGLSVEAVAPDFTPLPVYEGILVLEDGTYDCETGIFTPTAVVPLSITTVVKTDETVADANDGNITVTAEGGAAPLNYSKDNGATWQVSNVFTALPDGSYTVKVRDAATTTVAYATNPVVIAAGA